VAGVRQASCALPQKTGYAFYMDTLPFTCQIGFTVYIPQLDTLGDKLVASLDNIANAITEVGLALDQEIGEIAAALSNNPTPEQVEEQAQRLRDLQTRIQSIIP